MRVLVIEDESKVADALEQGLEAEGYDAVVARTGEDGFYLLSAEVFDVVILDLMLPGRDGLEILETLRRRGVQTPVLVLTARDAVEDRVVGLDAGADDYLVKPFAFPELLARIRAPLTAIRSVGEVALSERREAAEYRRTIGSMLEEVDRLTALVNALLVLSRADAGHTVISRESVDLVSLVNDVVEQLGVLAEEKAQSLAVEGEAHVSAVVDRSLLSRAVVNLVDNAIKYTREGGRIRVRVTTQDGSARIEVSDTGPGIPDEHRERIFDRFYRIDKSRSREIGGAGLGLSLARLAVEAHGGRIELDSSGSDGATFRIALPSAQRKGGSP